MVKFDYGKIVVLSPYTSKQEKLLLINTELYENFDLDSALYILKDNISVDCASLSDEEKISILYKLRSISISEQIPVKFKCISCGAPNVQEIDISNVVDKPEHPYENDQYKVMTEENFQDFTNIVVDEMEIDDYDELYDDISNKITKFNFKSRNSCHKCGEIVVLDISSHKYVVENLSEDSLMSLYKTTSDLVFYSHYSKYDVDNMLPFERSIFISLLNTTLEEKNK